MPSSVVVAVDVVRGRRPRRRHRPRSRSSRMPTAASTQTARERIATSHRSAADQSLGEVARQLVEADPLLRHRVALAHGGGMVVQAVEVDRHAVRRTDLVLPAVPPPDRTGVVEVDVPVLTQLSLPAPSPSGDRSALRDSGSTATLTGASRGSRRSTVRLSTPPLALGASSSAYAVDQERHQRSSQTRRRLDHVRRPAVAGCLVEVRQVLAGELGVLLEVEVGPVGDALELTPLRAGEAEAVLDVDGALGVVRQLRLRVLEVPQVVAGRCRDRCTTRCAGRSRSGATPRRYPARRRTPSPSARTRACGR